MLYSGHFLPAIMEFPLLSKLFKSNKKSEQPATTNQPAQTQDGQSRSSGNQNRTPQADSSSAESSSNSRSTRPSGNRDNQRRDTRSGRDRHRGNRVRNARDENSPAKNSTASASPQNDSQKQEPQERGGQEREGQGQNRNGSQSNTSQSNRNASQNRHRNSSQRRSNHSRNADQTGADNTADQPSERAAPPASHKPARTPWNISQFEVPEKPGKKRFHDFGLTDDVMRAISDLRFEYCSPIQAQSLPYALNGQDVVGKAQTGTGKTAAFLIAIIDDLINHKLEDERFAGEPRALILAPTRELVIQIAEDAKLLTRYTDLEVHALVGGMDYGKQQRDIQTRLVDILVATPGRLIDFASNSDVHLDQVEILVIDEADRMMDMGFIPQIRRIVRQTPDKTHRQTLLFSATFSNDVMHLVEQWTADAVRVEIEPESVATDTVTQYIYLASVDEKFTLLYNILKEENVENLIVFSNRRDECRRLHERLKAHGISAGLLSGEVAQNRRVKTLDDFKAGKTKVLVATDVAGRGIHIDGISHVVNFTLPEEPEDYVHRIGRTGRAGRLGTSISFACEDDAMRVEPIQKLLGTDLKCTQPPENLLIPPPHVDIPKEQPRRRPQRSGGGGGRGRGPRR